MTKFYNRTKISDSIPNKLKRENKYHLLPIYHLLNTSYLGSEGINNSGSYKFAEHIYKKEPKGKYGIGKILDYVLLNLPSANAFRHRHTVAKDHIEQLTKTNTNAKILSAPSGYATEFLPYQNHKGTFHGIDLDSDLVDKMNSHPEYNENTTFHHGDCLDKTVYPLSDYDLIISMGYVDFLPDEEAIEFFKITRTKLNKAGKFYTSSLLPHKLSDYLMRNIAELHTQYRNKDQMINLLREAGYKNINHKEHKTKLLTVYLAN